MQRGVYFKTSGTPQQGTSRRSAMIYEISIRGCDATTECQVELTPEEIKGIIKLAEKSVDESAYECYPNIEDIFCLDAGDKWLLWNAKAYKDEKEKKTYGSTT